MVVASGAAALAAAAGSSLPDPRGRVARNKGGAAPPRRRPSAGSALQRVIGREHALVALGGQPAAGAVVLDLDLRSCARCRGRSRCGCRRPCARDSSTTRACLETTASSPRSVASISFSLNAESPGGYRGDRPRGARRDPLLAQVDLLLDRALDDVAAHPDAAAADLALADPDLLLDDRDRLLALAQLGGGAVPAGPGRAAVGRGAVAGLVSAPPARPVDDIGRHGAGSGSRSSRSGARSRRARRGRSAGALEDVAGPVLHPGGDAGGQQIAAAPHALGEDVAVVLGQEQIEAGPETLVLTAGALAVAGARAADRDGARDAERYSWSRAASAAPRVSYIAVRVRSVIDGVPSSVPGGPAVAALDPLYFRALRPEPHGLANGLRAAPVIRISSLRTSSVGRRAAPRTPARSGRRPPRAPGRLSTRRPIGTCSTWTCSRRSATSAISSRLFDTRADDDSAALDLALAGGVLHIYNWSDYIDPALLKSSPRRPGSRSATTPSIPTRCSRPRSCRADRLRHRRPIQSQCAALHHRQGHPAARQAKLPGLTNLDPAVMTHMAAFDPGGRYAVPYMQGTIGIGYNLDAVAKRLPGQKIDSWAVVFDPRNLAKLKDCGVYFLDASEDMYAVALNYLGKDPNSKCPPTTPRRPTC